MRNKYVKQFFTLTEQNLSEHPISSNDLFSHTDSSASGSAIPVEFKTMFKQRFVRFVGFFLLLIAGILYVLHTHHFKVTPAPQVVKQNRTQSSKIPPRPSPQLVSIIPGYRVAAVRQRLQEISLRKADLVFLDPEEEEGATSTMAVMDKVLVIPKTFG